MNTFDDVEYKYYNGTWRDYSPELKDNLTVNGTLFNATLLSLIEDRYNLTSDEIDFVFNSHLEVRDTVSVGFSYLGNDEEIFSFDLGNSTETFPFTGSCSFRTAEISCVNGAYAHMVGNNATDYEENWTNVHYQNGTVEWEKGYNYGYYANAWYDGLMTFTFANDKVDNDVLAYWLNQCNRTDANGSLVYGVGPMKAAYGSFLEALLVIYMDDLVADAAAERYNVTWTRISPMVMSVHDYVLDTYMTGECDFYFGREAYGNLDNVKAFYFACSASFSLIERYVGENLFPGTDDLGAVTTGLGYILEHNGTLEIFIQDGVVLIREAGNDERVLIFDSETGLLHDAYYSLNGAFCYSNQQTDWALGLGLDLLGYSDPIWAYLLGLGDLPDLSRPTGSMLKSCNFFLGMSALFVVEGVELEACLVALTGIAEGLTIGALAVPIIISLPLLFIAMQPVGSQNETDELMEFYRTHNSSHDGEPSINNELVQVKNNRRGNDDDYEVYRRISEELNFFHWGVAVPPGDDGGNASFSKIFFIMTAVPYMWGMYYIGDKILKGLTSEHNVTSIKLKFNETTNKTDIIVYY